MIMAIAMVLGLCGLNVDTVKVNAATDPFEESIKNFPQSYKNYREDFIQGIRIGNF